MDDLLAACRILDAEGLTTAFGHVSARDDDGTVLISPRVGPGLVARASELVRTTVDGDVVEGDAAMLPGEAPLHFGAYRAREEVRAVCRFHGPALQAVATLGRALPAVTGVGMFLGHEVPLHAAATTVTTLEGGDAVAATLGAAGGVMIRGFGAITVGRDVREAVVRATFAERNAETYLRAAAVGEPAAYGSEDAAAFLAPAAARREQVERAWAYLCARAG